MADFVYDNVALPASKVPDIRPVPAGQETSYWGKTDANAVFDALTALRGHTQGAWVNVKSSKFGAVGDGSNDDTGAINAAIAAVGKGVLFFPPGVYRFLSTLTVPSYVTLRGAGFTDDKLTGNRAASVLLKDFNGQGVILTGDAAALLDLQVDSTAAKTGDGVQVKASRAKLSNLTVTNMGQDGIRIGADEGGPLTVNANLWRLDHVVSRGNGRHGLFIHHSNTSTTGTFPQGQPNVNAGTATMLDLGGNTGSGLDVKNAIDNKFIGVTAQTNTANGLHLEGDARGMHFFGLYTETNSGGEVLFDAGANFNTVWGTRFVTVSPGITDNGTGNQIMALEGDLSLYAFRKSISVSNRAAAGIAAVSFYADANQGNSVNLNATQSVGTGGKLAVQTKRNGNTPLDRLTIDEAGIAIFQNGAVVTPRSVLTYSATIATDASTGNSFSITATNGTAFTISNPTNLTAGQRLLYTIRNASGGALGAITWGATFKVNATAIAPANGQSRSIEFIYDGTNLVELWRSAVDVPN